MARVIVSKEAGTTSSLFEIISAMNFAIPTQRSGFLLHSKRAYYRWNIFPDAASPWMR